MAMIKCPQCGQTVLSVASVCPKCSYLLIQHATPQGENGGFGNCRRCGKVISTAAVECDFCGYPQRFRRHLRRGLGAIGILALVAIGVIVIRAVSETGGDADRPAPPAADTVLAAAPPPAVIQPDSAVIPPVAAPQVDTTAPAPQDSQPVAPPRLTRWTITWANVRDGRTTESAVIRILRPGEAVSVAEPAGGWWRVYERGQPIGYVAIDLLSTQPPEP
jgi:ribosomal protein L37E